MGSQSLQVPCVPLSLGYCSSSIGKTQIKVFLLAFEQYFRARSQGASLFLSHMLSPGNPSQQEGKQLLLMTKLSMPSLL